MASESALSCYNAPGYKCSKKANEQMDVYSFGIVLLELVTGRQAEPSESLNIVKWVRRKVNITNGAVQVIDPKITNSSQQEVAPFLSLISLYSFLTNFRMFVLMEIMTLVCKRTCWKLGSI